MKPSTLSLVSLTICGLGAPSMAHELSCPGKSSWYDATYVQRTSIIDGKSLSAEVSTFANATTADIIVDGNRVAVIRLRGKGNDAIALTFGRNRPKPVEFAEISMAVAPPMAEGHWKRMQRPCDVKDSTTIEINEKDMAEDATEMPVIQGSLSRNGSDFTYEITVHANGDEPATSWRGMLRFGEAARVLDDATDVQG